MLAIMLMLVGLAVMVGAKDIASRLAKVIVGAIALCIVIPCLVQWLGCLLHNASSSEQTSMPKDLLMFLLLVVFVAIGAAGWKLRAFRSRSRELAMRRHGAPRTRALPPPPPPSVGGQS
jgi:heme/copper-type cytochrome/quinol oxidase subunit 4